MAKVHLELDIRMRRFFLAILASIWRILLMIPLVWGIVMLVFGLFGLFFRSITEADLRGDSSLILTGYFLDVVYGLVIVFMLGLIGRFMYRATHAPFAFDPLPPKLSESLESALSRLCMQSKVSRRSVQVIYQRLNGRENAGVISSGGVEYLFLTLGFFKMLRYEPEKAEAMLAHEIGHMESKDTRLLLLTSACASVILYASLPINIIIAVAIAYCFTPIAPPELPPTTEPTLAADFFWQALINIVVLTIGYAILVGFRHLSEFIADSFACLHSGPDGTRSYLMAANEKKLSLNVRILHPTIAGRLKNVEYCRALLERSPNSFAPVVGGWQTPTKILGLSAVVFLFIWMVYAFLFQHFTNRPENAQFTVAPQAIPPERRMHGISPNIFEALRGQDSSENPPTPTPTLRHDLPSPPPTAPRTASLDLIPACRDDRVDQIDSLLRAGADPNTRYDYGQPVLFLAIGTGNPEALAALIQAGAIVDNRDSAGNTGLLVAAQQGRGNMVAALLSSNAYADAQNNAGRTALMNAAAGGSADCVQLLLHGGASPNIADAAGNTAMTDAARNGHQDVVTLLKQGGETS